MTFSGDGSVSATLNLSGILPNTLVACSACIYGDFSFALDQTFLLSTGLIYQIQMSALTSDVKGHASAYIDPFFSVPDGFTIDISANIGNAPIPSQTPIPAALPLFATGLGFVALAGLRRRRKAE